MSPLLAVHISEGILRDSWRIAGWAVTLIVVYLASRRIRDEEIPRIGLLTAVFFVASSIRLPVPVAGTSVHLVLNGLVGIILGCRAAVAILVGLFLQAALLWHGGFTVLGVNFCVMALPALAARPFFRRLLTGSGSTFSWRNAFLSLLVLLHPYFLGLVFLSAAYDRFGGLGRNLSPAFRAGFLTGFLSLALTAILNACALAMGGTNNFGIIPAASLAAHIPIAFLEGLVVGAIASFLERVKPELLE